MYVKLQIISYDGMDVVNTLKNLADEMREQYQQYTHVKTTTPNNRYEITNKIEEMIPIVETSLNLIMRMLKKHASDDQVIPSIEFMAATAATYWTWIVLEGYTNDMPTDMAIQISEIIFENQDAFIVPLLDHMVSLGLNRSERCLEVTRILLENVITKGNVSEKRWAKIIYKQAGEQILNDCMTKLEDIEEHACIEVAVQQLDRLTNHIPEVRVEDLNETLESICKIGSFCTVQQFDSISQYETAIQCIKKFHEIWSSSRKTC